MNSVNRFRPAKQFRCLPLVGKDAQFGYVEIINNAADGGNYQPADLMVEAFVQMNEKGREEWLKLTGGSEILRSSRQSCPLGARYTARYIPSRRVRS